MPSPKEQEKEQEKKQEKKQEKEHAEAKGAGKDKIPCRRKRKFCAEPGAAASVQKPLFQSVVHALPPPLPTGLLYLARACDPTAEITEDDGSGTVCVRVYPEGAATVGDGFVVRVVLFECGERPCDVPPVSPRLCQAGETLTDAIARLHTTLELAKTDIYASGVVPRRCAPFSFSVRLANQLAGQPPGVVRVVCDELRRVCTEHVCSHTATFVILALAQALPAQERAGALDARARACAAASVATKLTPEFQDTLIAEYFNTAT